MSTTQELLAANERYDALVKRVEELVEEWGQDSAEDWTFFFREATPKEILTCIRQDLRELLENA